MLSRLQLVVVLLEFCVSGALSPYRQHLSTSMTASRELRVGFTFCLYISKIIFICFYEMGLAPDVSVSCTVNRSTIRISCFRIGSDVPCLLRKVFLIGSMRSFQSGLVSIDDEKIAIPLLTIDHIPFSNPTVRNKSEGVPVFVRLTSNYSRSTPFSVRSGLLLSIKPSLNTSSRFSPSIARLLAAVR